MARHTVSFEEMLNYITQESWDLAAASDGKGSQKKLEISSKGAFRVTDHDKVIYHGVSLGLAVDAYNDAP